MIQSSMFTTDNPFLNTCGVLLAFLWQLGLKIANLPNVTTKMNKFKIPVVLVVVFFFVAGKKELRIWFTFFRIHSEYHSISLLVSKYHSICSHFICNPHELDAYKLVIVLRSQWNESYQIFSKKQEDE